MCWHAQHSIKVSFFYYTYFEFLTIFAVFSSSLQHGGLSAPSVGIQTTRGNVLIILELKTRHTHSTGTGLGRVPQIRPIPVPAQPIPTYPRGFMNLCYALVVPA